ncbi:hypothetical protein MEZE111188_08960 [Mesobacillus zeae]
MDHGRNTPKTLFLFPLHTNDDLSIQKSRLLWKQTAYLLTL